MREILRYIERIPLKVREELGIENKLQEFRKNDPSLPREIIPIR